ncbi:MAG: poly(A) polymerase [Parcubacteria group bacterium Gr01-1014_18]|nr:MAG: poly(A) polymerase [Parcubacteria group bacterium Greene0416_36]TSC80102.1 MAG: poly(A) polymerase [Parcubacteria group bacterium Gr01-1014_18]TSC98608.1 MAG: poly(A) polymerase [Parcubacteria group bacterium Greene1014_20]TSD06435.1 MAG: poly(A) polymerase [Parcubacteria group bacterium Greene0714_2]
MRQHFSIIQSLAFVEEIRTRYPDSSIFVVGGAVRDVMLAKGGIRDWDLVVRGIPIDELEALLADFGSVVLVGRKFGVFKLSLSDERFADYHFDIALPRTEFALSGSGRRNDFSVESNHLLPIEDDLSRRDFTINAMAWDLGREALVDPFGGQKDLEMKTIRAVGDPETRFREDYTRLLRAVRFAAVLGFDVEEKTSLAMKAVAAEISRSGAIPKEMIALEFYKSLAADPVRTLKLYDSSGILLAVFPELAKYKEIEIVHGLSLWNYTLSLLSRVGKSRGELRSEDFFAAVLFALLLHSGRTLGGEVARSWDRRIDFAHGFCRNYCLSMAASGIEESVTWMLKTCRFLEEGDGSLAEAEKLLFSPHFHWLVLAIVLREDSLLSMEVSSSPSPFYARLSAILQKLPIVGGVLPPRLVDGDILKKELEIESGPRMKELLASIREAQLRGKFKNQKDAIIYAKSLIK